MMKKKIYALIITLMILTSAILVIMPKNQNVKADPEGGGESTDIEFDLELIREITEELSEIVNTSYIEPGEIAKGRAFGTDGEHDAARYLNDTFNIDLGIDAYMERIENIETVYDDFDKLDNVTDKLEVLDQEIKINGTDVVDGSIRPRWNLTGGRYLDREYRPWFDYFYNVYDTDRLTHNFSYTDLKIYRVPD
ncbi:MAG: hypothetical protein DRN27_08150, partial [Thermoplasmata archaeon]